jgi:hypothetical protein
MKYLEEIHNQLTTRMLWVLALITIVFTYINMSQIAPNDFWWHMAIGRDIFTNRQIPLFDIYSFTMQGQPYPSYQMFWLMETWFYTLFSMVNGDMVLYSVFDWWGSISNLPAQPGYYWNLCHYFDSLLAEFS